MKILSPSSIRRGRLRGRAAGHRGLGGHDHGRARPAGAAGPGRRPRRGRGRRTSTTSRTSTRSTASAGSSTGGRRRDAALADDLANLSAGTPAQQALVAAVTKDREQVEDRLRRDRRGPRGRIGIPRRPRRDAGRVEPDRRPDPGARVRRLAPLGPPRDRGAPGCSPLNALLIAALLGAFAAALLIDYVVVGRRSLRSITNVLDGARVIGSGDLEHAIAVTGDDEVAELSTAFNRMTADLRTVTASRAELEREMEQRTRAEAEARSTALFPMQNPIPILRVDDEGDCSSSTRPAPRHSRTGTSRSARPSPTFWAGRSGRPAANGGRARSSWSAGRRPTQSPSSRSRTRTTSTSTSPTSPSGKRPRRRWRNADASFRRPFTAIRQPWRSRVLPIPLCGRERELDGTLRPYPRGRDRPHLEGTGHVPRELCRTGGHRRPDPRPGSRAQPGDQRMHQDRRGADRPVVVGRGRDRRREAYPEPRSST